MALKPAGQTRGSAETGKLPGDNESEASSKNTTKLKIRQMRADNKVFATGMEVVEHEIEIAGDGRQQIV
jgi:hypothetical protein